MNRPVTEKQCPKFLPFVVFRFYINPEKCVSMGDKRNRREASTDLRGEVKKGESGAV